MPTKLRGRTEKVGDDLGGESRRRVRVHMNVVPPSTMNTNGVTEKASNGRSNPEVVGSFPPRSKGFFLYLVWFPDSLY